MEKRPLIVIAGPTATGKSQIAVTLARRYHGEILCADSRQIYRLFDIGTAKPTLAEREEIPHHLLDLCEPDETMTLAQYKKQAEVVLNDIWSRNKHPILVGGTGLYIQALLYDYQIPEVPPQPEFRQKMLAMETTQNSGTLWAYLQQRDPVTADRLHSNDLRRIIRALEVLEYTGQSISIRQQKQEIPRYPVLYIALHMDKEILYPRIKNRIQQMIDTGLIAEVQKIMACYSSDLPLLATLNYRETVAYLKQQVTLEQTQADMFLHTRQYAKRQMTWFRQDKAINWFTLSTTEDEQKLYAWIETKICGKLVEEL